MKKQSKTLYFILLVVILLVGIGQYQLSKQGSITFPFINKERTFNLDGSSNSSTPSVVSNQVTISIDFGKGKKLEEKVEAKTVYEALKKITEQKNLQLDVQQYKYGLLVEKIGTSVNSADSAWMYWVNGKAGQIASDLFQVKPQDKIEWKYEKISQ